MLESAWVRKSFNRIESSRAGNNLFTQVRCSLPIMFFYG